MSRNKTGLICFLEELRTLENKIAKQMPRNPFIQILLLWIMFSLTLYAWYVYQRRNLVKMPVFTFTAIYSCNLATPWNHEVESVKYISKDSRLHLFLNYMSYFKFSICITQKDTFWWSCVSFFNYLKLWWLKHILKFAEFAVEKIMYQ